MVSRIVISILLYVSPLLARDPAPQVPKFVYENYVCGSLLKANSLGHLISNDPGLYMQSDDVRQFLSLMSGYIFHLKNLKSESQLQNIAKAVRDCLNQHGELREFVAVPDEQALTQAQQDQRNTELNIEVSVSDDYKFYGLISYGIKTVLAVPTAWALTTAGARYAIPRLVTIGTSTYTGAAVTAGGIAFGFVLYGIDRATDFRISKATQEHIMIPIADTYMGIDETQMQALMIQSRMQALELLKSIVASAKKHSLK